jgi:hypothetical protein
MSELTRGIEGWSVERKHHPFSPSSLQNREACPCYAGRDSQHVRSIAGTLAHSVVETRVDDSDLSDDDAILAADCADFVDGRKRIMELAWERAEQLGETPRSVQEFKEVELPIDDCKYEDADSTTSGFVDHLIIDHTETYGEMIDYKFGIWGVEPAENNAQCISYVLGAFRKFPRLSRIRFFFRQPAIPLNSDALFTREQIPALYLRITTIVARAREAKLRDDFSEARPAVPVCLFCANLGRCPKVCAMVCRVGKKFHPLEVPENITPGTVMSPENVLLGLRLSQVVKVWADAFRATTTDRILRGAADLPAGYKIVSQSRRELIDKDAFKRVALSYLTEDEYAATLDVLFGAVEKAISNKAPRGQKKHAVEQFQEDLEHAEATKQGQPYSFLKSVPVE